MPLDTLIDSFQDQFVAWEVSGGIGLIHPVAPEAVQNSDAYRIAQTILQRTADLFPYAVCHIGISDYANGLRHFARRFTHAQTAVRIGMQFRAGEKVYHFEDCGVNQIFAHYADTDDAADYVERTLSPLLAYDRDNGTDLVLTLKRILAGASLKEVAEHMFFHQKTILSRKQRIEKVLNVSLDSFEVRMQLGAAIHILKLLPPRH